MSAKRFLKSLATQLCQGMKESKIQNLICIQSRTYRIKTCLHKQDVGCGLHIMHWVTYGGGGAGNSSPGEGEGVVH